MTIVGTPTAVGAPPATDLASARQSLQSARRDLDDAVGLLPGLEGDNTMANPNLIALLLRAVVARRHLQSVEGIGVVTQRDDRWL